MPQELLLPADEIPTRNLAMPSTTTKPSSTGEAAPDLDILGDQVTIHPAGYVQPPSASHGDQERNLVEHMARFRESPFEFLREVSLHVSGAGWRAYDDVIGQPIFYSGFTDNMKSMVLRAPLLKTRIDSLAKQRVEVEDKQELFGDEDGRLRRKEDRKREIERQIREVAEKITDNMICKLESKRVIRSAYYKGMPIGLQHRTFMLKNASQESMSPAKRCSDYAQSLKRPQRNDSL